MIPTLSGEIIVLGTETYTPKQAEDLARQLDKLSYQARAAGNRRIRLARADEYLADFKRRNPNAVEVDAVYDGRPVDVLVAVTGDGSDGAYHVDVIMPDGAPFVEKPYRTFGLQNLPSWHEALWVRGKGARVSHCWRGGEKVACGARAPSEPASTYARGTKCPKCEAKIGGAPCAS